MALALLNGASIPGTIIFGMQSDRLHVTNMILITTLGAATSVLVLWGCSVSLPTLCAFSIVYGFFAGAFSTSYGAIMREVKATEPRTDSGIVFGMLCAGRGIGNIVSGPLSEALLANGGAWKGAAGLGYGTSFGGLIVFVGATAVFSGSSWVAKKTRWL